MKDETGRRRFWGNIPFRRGRQYKISDWRKFQMKVAVTYENGEVFQHFGRTPAFKVYEVADGKVNSSEVIDTNGTGHGALAGFLKQAEVDTLICGGIGGGAQMALSEAGITLYAGCSGEADEAVKALIAGTLAQVGEATCDHHHGEEHHCGHHGEGHEHHHHHEGGHCGHHHEGGHCGHHHHHEE
jgi:predicted Fe-Mo cluster-binding NifX family protein